MEATTKQLISKIEQNGFEWEIVALEEDLPVRWNLIDSGEDWYDRKLENEVIDRLDRGDIWAWCTVKVTVSGYGLIGTDYLGACCYLSGKDFIDNSGYFEDMLSIAIDDLQAQVDQANNAAPKIAALKD